MNQREALHEIIRGGYHLAHDDECRDVGCLAILQAFEPQWHKFDKDDETTWPTITSCDYWTVWRTTDGTLQTSRNWWNGDPRTWGNMYLFWMLITVPSPPESEDQ